jgi:hypothetical protein
MGTSAREPGKREQASIEYLAMYGIAVLVILVALVFLYSFLTLPSTSVPNTCQFTQAAICVDSVIGTNTVTSNTAVALFIENTEDYAMTSPNVIVRIGSSNSSLYGTQCQPNYIKPGGVVLCLVNLTQKTAVDTMLNGNLYLIANNCGISNGSNCVGAMRETYVGTFSGHTQAIESYRPSITISSTQNTLPPNGQKAILIANVSFLGSRVTGATVNFTADNTVPILGGEICGSTNTMIPCSSFSNSNGQGTAQSNIWSFRPVVVKVYATFAGASASLTIVFNNAPTSLARSCSTKGSGSISNVVITTSNEPTYDPLVVNPSSIGIYTLFDHATGLPVQIEVNGNGNGANAAGNCFSIGTLAADGPLSVGETGNNENTIYLISGPDAVSVGSGGNNNGETVQDSGNGPVSGSYIGNNGAFMLTSGTGNVVLTVAGNNQAVSNITTASSNVVFTLNGNNQVVNITATAAGANAVINEVGNNQIMNLSFAPGTTIIVPTANGNNNVFNSTGGGVIYFPNFGGNNNVLNLKNEQVYLVGSCVAHVERLAGNNNQVNLLGTSTYLPSSPYNSMSTAC